MKTNLIKAVLVLIMGVTLVLFGTSVLAADDGYTELTLNNTTLDANMLSNTNIDANMLSNIDANALANTNLSGLNLSNTNISANALKNNTSVYNTSNLPKTGIEDSIPVALLVVIFAISSVYAYKKVNDYRNI